MTIKKLIASAALLLASATAFATPQYAGETVSADITSFSDAGYYLWQDDTDSDTWHLRWTGIGADHDPVAWAGNIEFRDSSLGTTSTFQFETGGIYGDTMGTSYDSFFDAGADVFAWQAATNNTGGVDGIDFTIGSHVELMAISLGSSLFADLTTVFDDPGVASTAIFIGADLASTNVLVSERNGMMFQDFEVKVPEPNSIALLGLGLACLGLARRRQARAA